MLAAVGVRRVDHLREVPLPSDFLALGYLILVAIFWQLVEAAAWCAQDLRLAKVGAISPNILVVDCLLKLSCVVITSNLCVVVSASSELGSTLTFTHVGLLHVT